MTNKEHPILFSTEMVKAILEGRKTQTRRVITRPEQWMIDDGWAEDKYGQQYEVKTVCPYGQTGDRLWVRETWQYVPGSLIEEKLACYKADIAEFAETMCWRPSIFMPRWASRITLEVKEVRVQRVQEINMQDIWAEGCQTKNGTNIYFRDLWDSINAKRGYGWHTNPWVWVVSFEVMK